MRPYVPAVTGFVAVTTILSGSLTGQAQSSDPPRSDARRTDSSTHARAAAPTVPALRVTRMVRGLDLPLGREADLPWSHAHHRAHLEGSAPVVAGWWPEPRQVPDLDGVDVRRDRPDVPGRRPRVPQEPPLLHVPGRHHLKRRARH